MVEQTIAKNIVDFRFSKYEGNPVLEPGPRDWEQKDVFNPTAVVHEGKVYMFYRAEDFQGMGIWNGTSRIGLAISEDGFSFHKLDHPILEPSEPYELPGGCEDPRITKIDGRYYMTYTAFDGVTARLCLASSDDLIHWQKYGCMLPGFRGEKDAEWSKAGAILPQKVQNRYWMYFGEGYVYLAFSEDLVTWSVLPEPVLTPRGRGYFDADLVEPGPSPFVTEDGIVLLYNGAVELAPGHPPRRRYAAGVAVYSLNDPSRLVYRSEVPFLEPDTEMERRGQVDNVVFIEGYIAFNGQELLYYGMADSRIGVAVRK
ncbi:glycoside hydrolase family 130 protein [Alicyclobacillus sendaiensis]|uniref:Glycoside hydrolase family 130 protein n=1 Tax=Alicyclobacillus sendaiensis PA2 TaxID=3029425 RepID=A0ABT6XXE3_ALISE|nr:glycoside hydrolase family 130 protein [Alicyclobacillus sendaiensis]MDI9259765.1 glycoside hydrolase family 130 protein [Alicyclobacillus sendaiensis PA2]